MKYTIILLFLFFFIPVLPRAAITYAKWESRLGDHLIQYIKAKWLARKHNLVFLHKRFPYDDQLELFYHEKQLNQFKHQYAQTIVIRNAEPTTFDKNTLYEMEYIIPLKDSWQTILSDVEFMAEIKHMIRPHFEIQAIEFPQDIFTIAIHIRKGGGYDGPLASQQYYEATLSTASSGYVVNSYVYDKIYPLKFIPNQYYIDQLIKLSELLDDIPMYVHIFTDDPKPEQFEQMFKTYVNKSNITYGCRKTGNFHNKHVIEDFFNMAFQFDCLIRGGSNFACMADLIGNHKLIIRALKSQWFGNKLVVTKTAIVARNKFFRELIQESDEFIETFSPT